jgi:phosphoribosylamine--glycine ligase
MAKAIKFYQRPKDYKRIGEGDTGLNTGGMGVSPVPYVDAILMEKSKTRIVKQLKDSRKTEFHIKVLFSLG